MPLAACCEDLKNRVVRQEDQDPKRPNVEVQRCKVCNRRHITMVAEPGVIGLRGSDM